MSHNYLLYFSDCFRLYFCYSHRKWIKSNHTEIMSAVENRQTIHLKILLSESVVQKIQLKMPNTKLKLRELRLWIDHQLQQIEHELIDYDFKIVNQQAIVEIVYWHQQLSRFMSEFSSQFIKLHFIGYHPLNESTSNINSFDVAPDTEIDLEDSKNLTLLPDWGDLDGHKSLAFNGLPWRERMVKIGLWLHCSLLISLLIIGYFYFFIYSDNSHSREKLNFNRLELTQAIDGLTESNSHLTKQVYDALSQVDAQSSRLNLQKTKNIINLMGILSRDIPEGIWVTNLAIKQNRFELRGKSYRTDEIQQFYQRLNQSHSSQKIIVSIQSIEYRENQFHYHFIGHWYD